MRNPHQFLAYSRFSKQMIVQCKRAHEIVCDMKSSLLHVQVLRTVVEEVISPMNDLLLPSGITSHFIGFQRDPVCIGRTAIKSNLGIRVLGVFLEGAGNVPFDFMGQAQRVFTDLQCDVVGAPIPGEEVIVDDSFVPGVPYVWAATPMIV